ncbi:OmpA family protein [Jiella pelagia]|uniref:OmpA family protein n=1 Tax=Jiella pelagia TaxID=2986949 RepID=A0ABY7C5H4_9HYPH|nr:OmpA family protein [Jiella pelagia]
MARRSILAICLTASVAALLGAAGPAAADPAYDRREVADFLAKSADEVQGLGKSRSMRFAGTRGICVGLESECQAKARPKGFDMLINFDLDSATLTTTARVNLDEMAAALADQRLSAVSFVIEGHTDARGDDWYNDDLSRRRAASVRGYLLARGVAPDKIEAVGLGERMPRVSNPYDPVNRRVEMRVSVR